MPDLCDDCIDDYLERNLRDWAGVERLIQDRTPEGVRLDYKRDAYSEPQQLRDAAKADQIKKNKKYDLRKDATAMSNAGGGWLLLGIGEDSYGNPIELVGVDDLNRHEGTIRDILGQYIFPPLEGEDLRVMTVPHPSKINHGIIAVRIGPAKPGGPRGFILQDGDRIEFWVRIGKSNRAMRYEQIREAFRGGVELEEQRLLEGPIRAEVRSIQRRISSARRENDWSEVGRLLSDLDHYADPPQYGHLVRGDILEAVDAVITYPRGNRPPLEVMRKAFSVLYAALPLNVLGSMVGPLRRRLSENDEGLLRHAAALAHEVAYDGLKFERGLAQIYIGVHHLAELLKFSDLNALDELKDRVLSEFDRLREFSVGMGNDEAVRLLDYSRADALAPRDAPVFEPEGLEWVFRGEDSPRPDRLPLLKKRLGAKTGEHEES